MLSVEVVLILSIFSLCRKSVLVFKYGISKYHNFFHIFHWEEQKKNFAGSLSNHFEDISKINSDILDMTVEE